MIIRLGVVMDPLETVKFQKDTTLAMLWAAQARGWEVSFLAPAGLYFADGEPRGCAISLQTSHDPANWYQAGAPRDIALAELDIILMRKDPPFDMDYIYITYLLEAAETRGVLVANRPHSLRDCNEKLFAMSFPQCCPPLLVTADSRHIRRFHQQHGEIVLKPLDGMGGASIFRVGPADPNVGVIIETMTHHGSRLIMAQRYLPEIRDGDKRILLIDGEPVPHCLARVPAPGETRGNLAAGAKGEVRPLTDRDRWICSEVGPELRRRGLWFVGIDVIGDYLTEINVTSPTCVREIDQATGSDIAGQLLDVLASKLVSRA